MEAVDRYMQVYATYSQILGGGGPRKGRRGTARPGRAEPAVAWYFVFILYILDLFYIFVFLTIIWYIFVIVSLL